MFYRVAVIGSLLLGLASFAVAQNETSRLAQFNRPALHGMETGETAAVISGVVRSEDNRGISNARVEVRDMTGSAVASTYSGPNGSFQINGLATGRFEVVAIVGLAEAREQLALNHGENTVTLRVADHGPAAADAGHADSVSVAAMRVPEKARKALNKAHELNARQRPQDAAKEIARALEIYPQYSDAFLERGIMHFAAAELNEAESDLQQAIKYDPNNAMAYIAMGAVLNNGEKYDDAARALDRGVALAPNAWQGYFELARMSLAKGDFANALRNTDRARQFMSQDYGPLHLVRAHALMGLKNYPEAQSELEALLSKDPNAADSAQVRETLDQVKTFTARAASGK
jgi:Flp pilus assembly protein TadD